MASTTLGWRWAPKTQSTLDCDMRPRKVEFGDGYQQVTPQSDLLPPRSWDLTFEHHPVEVKAMEEFLRARKGAESFEFEDPDTGLPISVRCERFAKDPFSPVRHRLRAKFEEVRV